MQQTFVRALYTTQAKPKFEGSNDDEVLSFTVYPIKSHADIKRFQEYFLGDGKKYTQRRNYTLFTIGINIGLRAGDLLRLKVKHFINADGTFKDKVIIREEKTRKVREFFCSPIVRDTVWDWVQQEGLQPEDYLFSSRKKKGNACINGVPVKENKPDERLNRRSLTDIMRKAGQALHYPLPIGTHSMRKTWAYMAYMKYKDHDPYILATLQRALGHTSPLITLRYLGFDDEDVKKLYFSVGTYNGAWHCNGAF